MESKKREVKRDLVELSKSKYGLFNVDEWERIIADIISEKINEIDFSDTNRAELEKRISKLLYQFIDDFEKNSKQQKPKSIEGFLQGLVMQATDIVGQIRQQVPQFTNQIIDFLQSEDNRETLKEFIQQKVKEYTDNTFSATDYSQIRSLQAKYENMPLADLKIYLSSSFHDQQKKQDVYRYLLTGSAFLLILLAFRLNPEWKLEVSLAIAGGLLFLALGISLPMIEIDARISELSFNMLGEKISFQDQVLYYRSKSILEVVSLLISQSRVEIVFVGVLVLAFSILFPLSKNLASLAILHVKGKVSENKFLIFLSQKTGKWSMADVFVVAIFMAFIGFDGILSEQLNQLDGLANTVDIFTTNQSNLLFGFYTFLFYVLISLSIPIRKSITS